MLMKDIFDDFSHENEYKLQLSYVLYSSKLICMHYSRMLIFLFSKIGACRLFKYLKKFFNFSTSLPGRGMREDEVLISKGQC